jgi:ectoine hydroxylase-related dioxygenase (phytanoyl-CoA dioxygenase family)
MKEFNEKGYAIVEDIFSSEGVRGLIDEISRVEASGPAFRKSGDLFAIRQFLKEVPGVRPLIFTAKFKSLINDYFGHDYFVVKSIYFDKPATSNWFVGWHQDLTISVDKKMDLPGFGPWTVKQDQFSVQPPVNVLERVVTIRIHLDDTDEDNGALKVVPGSHCNGVYRTGDANWKREDASICRVGKGGVMIMRPLLVHSSNRTTNNKQRRVIHIEFCNGVLPEGLGWAEAEKDLLHFGCSNQ